MAGDDDEDPIQVDGNKLGREIVKWFFRVASTGAVAGVLWLFGLRETVALQAAEIGSLKSELATVDSRLREHVAQSEVRISRVADRVQAQNDDVIRLQETAAALKEKINEFIAVVRRRG